MKREKEERKIIAEERSRYAREIHDELSQNLTALSLNLQFCENLIDKDPEKARELIRACLNLITKSADELKYTIYEPAGLANSGLITMIKKEAESGRLKVNCDVRVKGKEKSFSGGQELILWRIFRNVLFLAAEANTGNTAAGIDILFDFGSSLPVILFTIKTGNFSFPEKKQSARADLNELFKKAEEEKLKVEFAAGAESSVIKITTL